jgi:hypothetical protein
MDADKLKQLEARLREMLETPNPRPEMRSGSAELKPASRMVVIRRRKGHQDKRICRN